MAAQRHCVVLPIVPQERIAILGVGVVVPGPLRWLIWVVSSSNPCWANTGIMRLSGIGPQVWCVLSFRGLCGDRIAGLAMAGIINIERGPRGPRRWRLKRDR